MQLSTDRRNRARYRFAFASVMLVAVLALVTMNVSSASTQIYADVREQATVPDDQREQLAPPRDGVTVVTSHLGKAGEIVALAPDGTLLYHNGTHDGYWDIDPSPASDRTVVYSATTEVHNETLCEPVGRADYCIRQLVERANLTTGEVEVLYSRVDPRYHASEWHDVDRLNESHYVVADMHSDEVFVVNVTSGIVTWEWSVQNHLSLATGLGYPEDWSHINDVEVLPNGWIQVSLRNQDQVVFLNRETGVVENWTLGSEDDYDVLYEQHNPDYIAEANGGPAVLVAGSENNRVVEYQREDGEWNRTWVWQDSLLQWPRDADRLSNGHTLITDTHGGRVIEVDESGDVVWRFDVPVAYEAERLNTGAESTSGPSATEAKLVSQTTDDHHTSDDAGSAGDIKSAIKGLLPNKLLNAVAYITPVWMGLLDLAIAGVATLALLTWLGLELWWSKLALQRPVVRK
jgi:hypothetical protein